QGSALCAEVHDVSEGAEMRQLAEKQAEMAAEMGDLQDRMAAADRLIAVDWEATFEKVRTANASEINASARTKSGKVMKEMGQALDQWYGLDHSLQALTEQHW